MIKLQNHIKPPKARRKHDQTSASEQKAFEAYQSAFRRVYGCRPVLTHFDAESRVATFETPTHNVIALTARRCKEVTKQFKAMTV